MRHLSSLVCCLAVGLAGCSTGNLLSRLDVTPSAHERGAVDPLPFLQRDDAMPSEAVGVERLAGQVRISASRTAMRTGAAQDATVARQLDRANVVRVLGITQSFLRVAVPDGTTGYLASSATTPALTPLRQQRLDAGAVLRERPLDEAPAVHVLASPVQVNVLGQFGTYLLVKVPSAGEGWVQTAKARPSGY